MTHLLEFLAGRPDLVVPVLVLTEITLIGGVALLICRIWRNDAATRYGIACTAMILIWLAVPATLILRARGLSTWQWSQKLYMTPSLVSELAEMPAPEPEPPSSSLPIVALWALGTVAVLTRFGVGLYRVQRLKRTAAPVPYLTGAAPVFVTEQVSGPVVVGALRPSVLLPSSILDGLSETELHDVLAHEFAHVARRHLLVAVLQRLTVALFWPHPFVHLLSRQMMEAREEVCDNVVLGTAGRARYARVLLRVAECRQSSGHFSASLGLFSLESNLEERVKSLLDPHRRISTEMNYRRISLASIVLLTGVTALAGARVQTELITVAVPAFDGLQAPEKAPAVSKKKIKSVQKKRALLKLQKLEAERVRLKAMKELAVAQARKMGAEHEKLAVEKALQEALKNEKRAKELAALDDDKAVQLKRLAEQQAKLQSDQETQIAIKKALEELARNKMVQDQIDKSRQLAIEKTKLDLLEKAKMQTDKGSQIAIQKALDELAQVKSTRDQEIRNRDLAIERAKLDLAKNSRLRLDQAKASDAEKLRAENAELKARLDAQKKEIDRLNELLRRRKGGDDDLSMKVPMLSDIPLVGPLFQSKPGTKIDPPKR